MIVFNTILRDSDELRCDRCNLYVTSINGIMWFFTSVGNITAHERLCTDCYKARISEMGEAWR